MTGENSGPRSGAVIVGIGNRFRGDDGVGCRVVELLAEAAWVKEQGVLVLDAGPVPENFIGKISRAKPARVLLVDACTFGGAPGEFRLFASGDLDGLMVPGFSTHTVALDALVALLAQESGAMVWLLGIQPATGSAGAGLSPALARTLPAVVEFIRRWVGAGD